MVGGGGSYAAAVGGAATGGVATVITIVGIVVVVVVVVVVVAGGAIVRASDSSLSLEKGAPVVAIVQPRTLAANENASATFALFEASLKRSARLRVEMIIGP